MFSCGDHVVYRMKKFTVRPGPRAKQIQPAEHGDFYDYIVDKFWIVEEVLNDGRLILRTRRGKKHIVDAEDPNLHSARWWERMVHGWRFPTPSEA